MDKLGNRHSKEKNTCQNRYKHCDIKKDFTDLL